MYCRFSENIKLNKTVEIPIISARLIKGAAVFHIFPLISVTVGKLETTV